VGQFFRGVCSEIYRFPDGFLSKFPLKKYGGIARGWELSRDENIG
jgi:hypothetical protein